MQGRESPHGEPQQRAAEAGVGQCIDPKTVSVISDTQNMRDRGCGIEKKEEKVTYSLPQLNPLTNIVKNLH